MVTETFIYEPARWLAARGHDVTVVTRRRGGLPPGDEVVPQMRLVDVGSPRAALLRAAIGAPMATLAALRRGRTLRHALPWMSIAVAESLLSEIRRADSLLAHYGPVGLSWLPAAAIAGRPIAVYFHGYDATRLLQEEPRRYARLFASGAALLTNSEYLAHSLVCAGAPPERVSVVPLGVDPSIALDRAEPRGHRIVSVARLVPKKGLAVAIHAFAALRRASRDPWEYEIVGDGPLRGELVALARQLGVSEAVHFRGFLSRAATRDVLRRASVFLLASHSVESGDTEGTPVAILEAATLGLPVVATRHAGIPEILPPEAEEKGFLVVERDAAALADALIGLAASERARQDWGEACARFVRRRHSAEAHVAALTAALQRHARVPELFAATEES